MDGTDRSLWHDRNFLRLWLAQTFSIFGCKLTDLAIPLLAVNSLKATATQMGWLAAMEYLPTLAVGLLAGLAIDRWPKRPVMIGADFARLLLLAAVTALSFSGHLSIVLLLALVFVMGCMTIGFDMAQAAYVPVLVRSERLVEANGKLQVSASAAVTTGPALAGGIVQLVAAPIAILINAATFGLSALLLRSVRHEENVVREERAARSVWSEIFLGIRFIFQTPVMRALTVRTCIYNAFAASMDALLILYLSAELKFTPALIGATYAMAGVGVFLGASFVHRIVRHLGVGTTINGSLTLVIGMASLFALAREADTWGIVAVGLANFCWGFFAVVQSVSATSARQALAPRNLLGKVSSANMYLALGIRPIFAVAAGALGAIIGLRGAMVCALAAGAVLAALGWSSKVLRELRELPQRSEPA
jgi:MFS family permease